MLEESAKCQEAQKRDDSHQLRASGKAPGNLCRSPSRQRPPLKCDVSYYCPYSLEQTLSAERQPRHWVIAQPIKIYVKYQETLQEFRGRERPCPLGSAQEVFGKEARFQLSSEKWVEFFLENTGDRSLQCNVQRKQGRRIGSVPETVCGAGRCGS